MGDIKIKSREALLRTLKQYDIPVSSAWGKQALSLLWDEIKAGESKIVLNGEHIHSEVWAIAAYIYHHDQSGAWYFLTSRSRYETSMSGKYAHLKPRYFGKESAEQGFEREITEELGIKSLKKISRLHSETTPKRSTQKYPGLERIRHMTYFAGLIHAKDYKPGGYRHKGAGGHTEYFDWTPCDTPKILQNRFS